VDADLSRYESEIDLANPNGSHSLLVALAGEGRRVLDVGCWTGGLGKAFASRGCTVTGVELDPEAARRARSVLSDVVEADLEQTPLRELFEPGSFDVIVFGDVLEHVTQPGRVLRDALDLLAPEGRVLASIPNVGHGSVRLALLRGDWQYTDTGLLDRTHLRFFSRQGVLDLFSSAGMVVDELKATIMDPLGGGVDVRRGGLPVGLVEWVRDQPDSLVFQYVVAARLPRTGEVVDNSSVDLVPAVPLEQARLSDEHTERAAADLEARHRVLTVRDHIVGLEAQAATAQSRASTAEQQLRGALKRLDRKNARIRELARQVKAAAAPEPAGDDQPATSAVGRVRRRLTSR